MTGTLTPSQAAEYERDGILFPLRVLADEEVQRFRGCFEALVAGLEGRAQPVRQPHLSLRWAYDLATHPAVAGAVEGVLGPDVLVHSTIIFFKRPGDGGYVSWHQDGLYATLRAPRLTSAWIALSESTVENGCMRVIPGTHSQGILPHLESPSEDNLLRNGQSIEGVDEERAVDVVLRPGEMSLHHGDIVHGSNPNRSTRERIGFIARFVTPEVERAAHPLIRVRGTAPCPHVELMAAPPAG
jgi:ectoine hydroxylase-related dioxygenase (phytanoyl-CoA dioxygenase family)